MNEPNASDPNQTQATPLPVPDHTTSLKPTTGETQFTQTLNQQKNFTSSTEERHPKIKGYEITAEIARGGMGRVLEGREIALNREVAIKVLLPGANDGRFVLESKITARLPHPNIPPVHALGTLDDGSPYLVMKRIRGEDLAKALKNRKDPKENLPHWIQVFESICLAVGFAHSKGIIHRDLKPANVMVGEFGEVQVMDWGLAKDTNSDEAEPQIEERRGSDGEDLTIQGAVMGTPSYMAPEQARGESVNARADVFALGGILTCILTGEAVFTGKYVTDILSQAATGNTKNALARLVKSGADNGLVHIARACLAVDPKERPKNAHAVADLVKVYREGVEARLRTAEATRASDLAKSAEQAKKRKALQIAGGVILAVSIIGIGVSSFFAWRASERAETEAKAKKLAEDQKIIADDQTTEAKKQEGIAKEQEGIAKTNEEKAKTNEIEAKKQEGIAKLKAEEAKKQEEIAKTNELEAKKQLDRAERLVYASKLSLAQSAFSQGNGVLALQYLNECQWNLRGWEHRHLWTQFNSKQTLASHTGSVLSVAFSPAGKRIVSGSEDKTLKLWDAEKGQEILTLKGHTSGVSSVAFSPDSRHIVSGSYDGTVKIWDAEKGREILNLNGHTLTVTSVSWSPDGKRILTGSYDKTVKVWDAEIGTEVITLKGHTNRVLSVAFSPNGKHILSGSEDRTLKLWDTEKGQELFTLNGHTVAVRSVAFSPDGRRIISGSVDKSLKLWDAEKGIEITTLKGHTDAVSSVVFSPDGKRIVSGSFDKTLKLWDAEKGTEILTLSGHAHTVLSVAFSPDGKRIVSGSLDKTLRFWVAEKGQEILTLTGHTGMVFNVAFSPDGKRIISGSFDKSLKLWDAEKGTEILTLKGHTDNPYSVAFSPDGKRIVSGSYDTTLKLWDTEKGQEILTLKGHAQNVLSVAFSPDGKRIVSGSADKTLKLWDVEKGTEILTLKGHTGGASSVAWSPNGKQIISGSWDKTLKLWDAEKGTEIITLKGHTNRVLSVVFSPDSKRILSGSDDKTLKLWNAEMGTEILTIGGHTQYVLSVAFSPDGKRIVSGSDDKTAIIWDTEKGTKLHTLKGHTGGLSSVMFSPDGKRIVSGSFDKTAIIWTGLIGTEIFSLLHTRYITHTVFSPDNTKLFAWDILDKVLAWDAKTGQPIPADNPPPKPATSSNSSISPDGRLAAKPEGLNISLIDLLKPPPPDKSNEWPLPTLDERKKYHTEQAKLAEDAKQYFAQAFHLGRLLLDDPENKDLKDKREKALKLHSEATPDPKPKADPKP